MKKLTPAERFDIARRLSVLDREALIGVEELAVLFNTTVARIYQASSARRQARTGMTLELPKKVVLNGRRACWLHGQVRDTIAKLTTPPALAPVPPAEAATPSNRRKGRKRKAI